VDTTQTITHLSLCAGYGGIDLGLGSVLPSMRAIAYVEIEAFPCANLVAKMQEGWLDAAPIWTNLKTFDARPFRGQVDILSGGFPCQPFSHAGQRKGTEDPRHLFPEIERIIRECEPKMLFLENVEGIISSKYGGTEQSVLHHVLGRLESMGYRAEAGLFSAEECLYPHRRKRVFIGGISNTRCDDETTRRQCKVIQEGSDERDAEGRSGCDVGGGLLQEAREGGHVNSKNVGHSGGSARTGREGSEGERNNGAEVRCETKHVCELGDTTSNGRNKRTPDKDSGGKEGGAKEGRMQEPKGGCCEFPSRPEEDQHYWEAPRTIGSEEVIAAMGGSTYGSADGNVVRNQRIDSLRALGNGVVPATAARAFVILMDRLGEL